MKKNHVTSIYILNKDNMDPVLFDKHICYIIFQLDWQ